MTSNQRKEAVDAIKYTQFIKLVMWPYLYDTFQFF